ncbi:MAG TPA: hypothetical protein VG838_00720, partial [Opitutaceae bacterium]|nr:hypothetical protein [Opitutaceae bacterium]HWB99261.1 hypothetical protein [Bryobacteraceae bacterium]
MKASRITPSAARLLTSAFMVAALVSPTLVRAQAPSPQTLAKYDKNGNGRLDPDELAAMQA